MTNRQVVLLGLKFLKITCAEKIIPKPCRTKYKIHTVINHPTKRTPGCIKCSKQNPTQDFKAIFHIWQYWYIWYFHWLYCEGVNFIWQCYWQVVWRHHHLRCTWSSFFLQYILFMRPITGLCEQQESFPNASLAMSEHTAVSTYWYVRSYNWTIYSERLLYACTKQYQTVNCEPTNCNSTEYKIQKKSMSGILPQ